MAIMGPTTDQRRTLRDCEAFLNDNTRFQRSAGFVNNVFWRTSTERDVNSLRQRVHFHMTKINFIAKPFEYQLLLGIHRELQRLRRDVAELRTIVISCNGSRTGRLTNGKEPERYFPVPEELNERFTGASSVNSLSSFYIKDDLPLKDGFDALIYHFANSTVNFKPSFGHSQNVPQETHYLNLVKSRWIAGKIRQSEHFHSVGQESLWTRCMTELQDDITNKTNRFETGELVVPSLEVLRRLPDPCFSIWVTETRSQPAAHAEQRPYEEKILEVAIDNPPENFETTLTVFAQTDSALRVVSTTKDEQNKYFHGESGIDVNMNFTRLVPMFAASEDYSVDINDNTVCLYGNQGQAGRGFSFRHREDVAGFQRGLTSYHVSYEISNVSWHIEFGQIGKSSISGQAAYSFDN